MIHVDLDESDRQMTLLALAALSRERPGFDHALSLIAQRLRGWDLFETFKANWADAFPVVAGDAFRCPDCGAVSHHPEDLRHGYCAACHAFTARPTHPFARP